jgi:AraC-like DNA-binding protein
MSFGWLNLILLIGAAQGFLLTIVILHKYGKLFANRFLALLIGLFSIVLLNLFLEEVGAYNEIPYLFILLDGIPLLIFPLYYLYARHLIQHSLRLTKPEWIHFLPFIIYKLYSFADFFKSKEQLNTLIQSVESGTSHGRYMIYNWVIAIQGLIYMFWTLTILLKYSKQIRNVFSSTEKIKLNWFRNVTIMTTGLLIIFVAGQSLTTIGIDPSHFFDLTSLLFAVLVYAIGYIGLVKSEIFMEPDIGRSLDTIFERKDPGKKYQKSGLSAEKAKSIMDNLLKLMEEKKPYLDSNLTLMQLGTSLKISPHNLSEAINTQRQQTFFDFINHYRVEQVKGDLADPQKQPLTFLALAMEAGFNSKSSFNAIFKKHTGMTPSEYQKRIKDSEIESRKKAH